MAFSLESVPARGGENCGAGVATAGRSRCRARMACTAAKRFCIADAPAVLDLGGLVLIFFALSTNQEYYTFPAYLPLLLLLADGMARCEREECESGVRAGWLTGFRGLACRDWRCGQCHMLWWDLWQSRNLPFEPDIGLCWPSRI